jgi:hypothetical protein
LGKVRQIWDTADIVERDYSDGRIQNLPYLKFRKVDRMTFQIISNDKTLQINDALLRFESLLFKTVYLIFQWRFSEHKGKKPVSAIGKQNKIFHNRT